MRREGLTHAYPEELAALVIARLEELGVKPVGLSFPEDTNAFNAVLSVAYQASLLRDEDRPLTFRVTLAPREAFDTALGPPDGAHTLHFNEPRALSVPQLKKLAPAVKFERSVVAVYRDGDQLAIWGLLHTGPRWLRFTRGGRGAVAASVPALIVHVNGPGDIVVSLGIQTLARLYAGELNIPIVDVFQSRWLPGMFAPVRDEITRLHKADRAASSEPWSDVDTDVIRRIGQSFIRRIIATIRGARHGGSVLIVPPEDVDSICVNGLIDLKYRFSEGEPRQRFRTLMRRVMRTLAQIPQRSGSPIGWAEYESSETREIGALEEAVLEMAHLVSALADVDGLVLMTRRFELVGFGGIVSGALPDVSSVSLALDVEGQNRLQEPADVVGTRHRSAYRICRALPEALALVVSQDGSARFVRYDDEVVYWEQIAASAFNS